MAEQAKPAAPARRKVTIPTLVDKMKKGEPIVQLAVYDYETAIVADRVGIDILCVSDTGGMVLFGHEDTTSVSFEEVMFMALAVKRGSKYGLRMVDMPYMSFHLSPTQAVDNAAKYVSQGGAEVMKCEGNRHHARNIEAIIKAGIPVQGHIGITPMRMPQLGGFFAQGKTAERAKELIDDAWAMVDAGCFSIMCEVTTSEVCEYLAETLPVPPLRETHAAALQDLLRHGADPREGPGRLSRRRARATLSGARAHSLHEARGTRALQGDGGLEEVAAGRSGRAGVASAAGRLMIAESGVLAQARFFSGLVRPQLERVGALAKLRTFPKDTRIYVVGDPVDDFYVLADGMVRFTLGLGKRETSAGEIIRRGDVFGWAALVAGHSRRIATAYCLTPCEVLAINGAELLALMDADPALGYALMKQLAALLTSELVTFAAG
jgi:3-methyl-2-oxobutanoate hydroxymethyltransferase